MKEIQKPKFTDAENDPAFPIIKTDRTTNHMVSRLNGTTAQRLLIVNGKIMFVTKIVAFEAMEGQGGYFSQPGDSGSACADAKKSSSWLGDRRQWRELLYGQVLPLFWAVTFSVISYPR